MRGAPIVSMLLGGNILSDVALPLPDDCESPSPLYETEMAVAGRPHRRGLVVVLGRSKRLGYACWSFCSTCVLA